MSKLKTNGVAIFLEKRRTRMYVGALVRDRGKFVFTYDESYFTAKNVTPLGPEFPLTQRQFESEKLFPSLEDRIPSRQNPAYSEYCEVMEITPEERDPLILLSTIGRKGPSSFIFYPMFEHEITAKDLIAFRKSLDLTTREFAGVFDISQSSLNALERNRTSGKEILKRLEVILNFSSVALYFLLINGGCLVHEKLGKAMSVLKERAQEELKWGQKQGQG